MDVVIVLSLAAIPLGILLSALRDRSVRRRSRFWWRFAGLLACITLPWVVALAGMGGEQAFVTVLWLGLGWGLLLVALGPLLLFRGPGRDPGGSDDGGPGPGPDDDRPLPPQPRGGIPLPDAEPSATRVRGPHRPRRAKQPRRPAREPGPRRVPTPPRVS